MVSGYRDKLSDEITRGLSLRTIGTDIVKVRGKADEKELK